MAAFGDAYKVMSISNKEDKDQFVKRSFIEGVYYAYLTSLGEFGDFKFG